MFASLVMLLAAASCSIHGHPLEVFKYQHYSKYFQNSRIVGGEDAPEGYGKHMAALVFGSNWVSLVCGGSIITKRHILSAAHCIEIFVDWDQELMPSFRAIIGTKTWSTGTHGVRFIKYVLHSGWDSFNIKYDVGVLTVAADIIPSDSIAIIPVKFDWVDEATSYVTGWGVFSTNFDLPKVLQLLYVRSLSHKECEKRMRWAAENLGPAPPIQKDIEICTLHSPGHGMCNGDSGSALVLQTSEELIGLVSWGYPCAHGIPDIHARISGFKDFLLKNTEGYLG